jgi:molecular chaperone GrpE
LEGASIDRLHRKEQVVIGDDPLGMRRTTSGLWTPGSEAGGDEEGEGSSQAQTDESRPPEDRSGEIAEEEPAAPADELASARAEAAENRESWLRAAAELENYRRRTERELAETSARAQAEVLRSLLGVLDDVDRALEAVSDSSQSREASAESSPAAEPDGDPIVTGVRLIRARLLDILRQYGVVEIEARGALFDPHDHEAVMQIESKEVADGHVAQVLERGYRIGDRVLRPAKVAVAHAGRA